MNSSDIKGLTILSFLYLIQGLLLGLNVAALLVLLVEKGVQYAELAMIGSAVLPFSLKMFVSPLIDAYNSPSFGQRKSYIVPIHYFLGITGIYLSFVIQQWVNYQEILYIALFAWIQITMCAISDIAIDGWIVSLISPEIVTYGSVSQSFCQSLGWFLSQFVFIALNSAKFCNEWFFSQPSDQGLITLSGYYRFIGLLTLLITLYIHFSTEEKTDLSEEKNTFTKVFSTMRGFLKNKNIIYVALLAVFQQFGFGPIDGGGILYLIRHGFPKETISEFGMIIFCFDLIIPLLYGKFFAGRQKEFTLIYYFFILQIIQSLIYSVSVNQYVGPGQAGSFKYLLFGILIVKKIADSALFVLIMALILDICDPTIGATYVTILASLSNFGRSVADPLSLRLMGVMSFFTLCLIGLAIEIAFGIWFYPKIAYLETLKKEAFALNYYTMEEYQQMKNIELEGNQIYLTNYNNQRPQSP